MAFVGAPFHVVLFDDIDRLEHAEGRDSLREPASTCPYLDVAKLARGSIGLWLNSYRGPTDSGVVLRKSPELSQVPSTEKGTVMTTATHPTRRGTPKGFTTLYAAPDESRRDHE